MISRHYKAVETGDPEYFQNGGYENTFTRINGERKITRRCTPIHGSPATVGCSIFFDPELIEDVGQVFDPKNRV